MGKLRVLSLFAGIGGFDLGLERTGGFETVAFCEIDPFCQRVLAKHWPKVPCYDDIRKLSAERLATDGIAVDGICGGFPCQDISISGMGEGLSGSRSGLWFEYARLVGELRPSFIFVENVAELLNRGLGDVLGSLAALGYDAVWDCIPAAFAGAPIIRDRIWIFAVPQCSGWQRCFKHFGALSIAATTPTLDGDPFAGARSALDGDLGIVRSNHGFSVTMERARIGQFGNAVVPQVVELFGRAILSALSESKCTHFHGDAHAAAHNHSTTVINHEPYEGETPCS
jgi:DNA (cytosine-5)-methyltransferase 1